MPTLYAYASGFNIALVSLTTASPQPFSRIIRTPERRPTIARTVVVAGGKIATWTFSGLTLEQLDTLMAGMGLTFDAPSANVTIYTKTMTASAGVQDYIRCNAIVTAPNPGESLKAEPLDNVHYQDVIFTFNILEVL